MRREINKDTKEFHSLLKLTNTWSLIPLSDKDQEGELSGQGINSIRGLYGQFFFKDIFIRFSCINGETIMCLSFHHLIIWVKDRFTRAKSAIMSKLYNKSTEKNV